MTKQATGRDIQRTTFIDSLHASLRKQAEKAIVDHEKFIKSASAYLSDGLDKSECIELLMIDGCGRDSAEAYVAMAVNNSEKVIEETGDEYNFLFEDIYGKTWSSYDIGKHVKASSEDDAWILAEELLFSNEDYEPNRLLSVSRI